MSKILWNQKEIPIPEGAHINNNDHRVYLLIPHPSGKVRNSKRVVIGRQMSSGDMCPNTNFKHLCPELWNKYYEDKAKLFRSIYPGLYALTLGIAQRNGLYEALIKAYGSAHSNAFLDYAMYSVKEQTNVMMSLSECLRKNVTFSNYPKSDTWMSEFFGSFVSEDDNIAFRDEWIESCKKRGLKSCWLSIDGSNNDCSSTQTELAEKGHSKSGKNINIISYMYAVDTDSGMPVTYSVYNGSKIDCQAFHRIATLLKSHNLEISGVILDRGFCTKDVIQAVKDLGYDYIVMLKSETYGHKKMLERSEEIRWKSKYIVDKKGLFGISAKEKIFSDSKEPSNIHLYFDAVNGAGRSVKLIEKILMAGSVIENKLQQVNTEPEIPAELKKILSIGNDENGKRVVQYNYDVWDSMLCTKGFSSIASSNEQLSSAEVDKIYHSRDVSEKIFGFIKSKEDSETMRVHQTTSILNKFAACFIATIIRTEIVNTAKALGYKTSAVIKEMERIELSLQQNDLYMPVKDYSGKIRAILKYLDLTTDCFDDIAADVNYTRRDNNQSQSRKLTTITDLTEVANAKLNANKDESEQKIHRGKGRPKGSKNKSTLERERLEAEAGIVIEVRGRGRPKGSKNKSTLAKEAAELAHEETPKRGRGRPKGSKNKPKIPKIKRGRGRPKGSGKKLIEPKIKRGPGRPKGSKNKA